VLAGGLELNSAEQLGKSIYFDDNLSINRNQACAACHGPDVGFTGPIEAFNEAGAVYEGSIPGRFGNRKPPSAAYATTSPLFDFIEEKKDELFIGGNFWDGRATGYQLGNPAADQAVGPFLNPAEQGLPDAACVVHRVCIPTVPADYPVSFETVWGMGTCDIAWPADVEAQCATEGGHVMLSDEDRAQVMENYGNIGRTIAAFEGSYEVNAYTSKYDYYLAGMVKLTHEEKMGLNMFKSKGKCANCHVLDEGPDGPPLFTDYSFDNLGVPINADNPAYISTGFIDPGLGGFLATQGGLWGEMADENMGKQKVPTLRNVAKAPYEGFVKAYTHNGYFKTLEGVVHFYNTRDVKNVCPDPLTPEAMAIAMNCWPAPEVMENVNHDELGDLKLTDDQEKAIVAFLKTLSDGYMP
jgi:cytochrome c peroxidase